MPNAGAGAGGWPGAGSIGGAGAPDLTSHGLAAGPAATAAGAWAAGGGRRRPRRVEVSREQWGQVRSHVRPGRRGWRST